MTLHYKDKTLKLLSKLLELINEHCKIAEYKINIKKISFLYTNNEIAERTV